MALWNSKEGRESANRGSSKREYVPLLVTIDEPRGNSTDVRTGANEQEDNEQERLEIEKRRLCVCSGRACQFEPNLNGL
jgi:hypothetical protein